MASDLPQSVADVPPGNVEPAAMAAASNLFLDLLQPSQFEHGKTAGLGGRGAGVNLVGGCHVDERLQLVVQILFGAIPARDPEHDGPQAMQQRHAPSRTHVTANVARFQRSRCCSSWRFPAAVSR